MAHPFLSFWGLQVQGKKNYQGLHIRGKMYLNLGQIILFYFKSREQISFANNVLNIFQLPFVTT